MVGVQWRGGGEWGVVDVRGGGEWGCGRCTMKRRWRMGVGVVGIQ